MLIWYSHIEKARINALDILANALEMAQTRLNATYRQQDDLDADLKVCTSVLLLLGANSVALRYLDFQATFNYW